MNFYLVTEGFVEWVDPGEVDPDFENSALVVAQDEADAFRIAQRYDARELDFDNVWVPSLNRFVAAVIERD